MPTRIYRIEILGDGGKDASPLAVIEHDAPDDLEAYLSAEARVRDLAHPEMVSWRLLMMSDNAVQPVRLNKEQQRVADQRRDDVFFAARRDREAAEKAKTERLKAQRLAAVKPRMMDLDGMAVSRFGRPRRLKNKIILRDDAD